MGDDYRISQIMEKHLEAIDLQMDAMIASDFDHFQIHLLRERIREFRALMFFNIAHIRPADYRMIEFVSKKVFNMTSLIREIDVFESGYRDYMSSDTLAKLAEIKAPLVNGIKEEIEETNGFRFHQVKIHVKPFKSKEKESRCFSARQCELFNQFIELDESRFSEEKYIHSKRMLAKKLIYIHRILMSDRQDLEALNLELESFQEVAKKVHDVCVNLRFIGQYALEDHLLINKLIEDHARYAREAEDQYLLTCNVIKRYLDEK